MKKLKILLACLFADFGESGNMKPDFSNASWEYHNIYQPLQKMANKGEIELETHWFDRQNNEHGMQRLISIAKDVDFIFQVAVNHGLSIHKPYCDILIAKGVPIIDYPPDVWARFDHHSPENWIVGRINEGYVTHYVSPAKHVISLMEKHGLPVKYMPFGIPDSCIPIPTEEKKYDISFVGQKHGVRGQVIDSLIKAGVKIDLFGHYWNSYPNWHGRPSMEDVNLIFNQSKINLNLRWTSRSAERGLVNGRSFEILGAGGFMLTTQHEETNEFRELYTPGIEFDEHHYVSDLITAIPRWLEDEEGRNKVAFAAFQKREQNLWTTRFRTLFSEIPEWLK